MIHEKHIAEASRVEYVAAVLIDMLNVPNFIDTLITAYFDIFQTDIGHFIESIEFDITSNTGSWSWFGLELGLFFLVIAAIDNIFDGSSGDIVDHSIDIVVENLFKGMRTTATH